MLLARDIARSVDRSIYFFVKAILVVRIKTKLFCLFTRHNFIRRRSRNFRYLRFARVRNFWFSIHYTYFRVCARDYVFGKTRILLNSRKYSGNVLRNSVLRRDISLCAMHLRPSVARSHGTWKSHATCDSSSTYRVDRSRDWSWIRIVNYFVYFILEF